MTANIEYDNDAMDTLEEVYEQEGHVALPSTSSGRAARKRALPSESSERAAAIKRGKKIHANTEPNPKLYGLRRSGRSKAQPRRYEVGI